MKKIGFWVSALMAGVVLAAFNSSVTYTVSAPTTTLGVTNVSQSAWYPSGIEWSFPLSYSGTCKVSRVRGSVTNLLVSQVVTAATSVMMNEGEFAGIWFVPGDVLLVQQFPGTNVTINLSRVDSYEP